MRMCSAQCGGVVAQLPCEADARVLSIYVNPVTNADLKRKHFLVFSCIDESSSRFDVMLNYYIIALTEMLLSIGSNPIVIFGNTGTKKNNRRNRGYPPSATPDQTLPSRRAVH